MDGTERVNGVRGEMNRGPQKRQSRRRNGAKKWKGETWWNVENDQRGRGARGSNRAIARR